MKIHAAQIYANSKLGENHCGAPTAGGLQNKIQSGQALVEFIVAAVAIMPLLLLLPLIAKYQDIDHSTLMASRYAALDAISHNDQNGGWRDPAQIAGEIRRRFFSNLDAPIKTSDTAGDFASHRNKFWTTPAGAPLVESFERDVQLSFGKSFERGQDGGFMSASDAAPFVLHSQLDLPAKGIYTANVLTTVAQLPSGSRFYEPFDSLNLRFVRSTSVAIGPWAAKGPADVERKIAHSPVIFPAGQLASVSSAVSRVVSAVDLPGAMTGPKLGQLDFWSDVVPEDRLITPR